MFSLLPLALLISLAISSPLLPRSDNTSTWSNYTFPGTTCQPPESPEALSQRNYFYVGGTYMPSQTNPSDELMTGQLYVEQLIPRTTNPKPYPLVFWHGAGQTGTNWLNTPDGRQGWASYFLQHGYIVYIVDQPQRGRSAWELSQGNVTYFSVQQAQEQFTAPELYKAWPQAITHTQWPGNGTKGDPIFDQFCASQVQYQQNITIMSQLNRDAGAALFNKIGPAILVMHSQGGQLGWAIADAAPENVKAVFALEPSGPPFADVVGLRYMNQTARPWGLTAIPIAYDPPVKFPGDLQQISVPPTATNLTSCFRQQEPAKRLVNLSKMPIAVMTTQASYHAPYDYCTVGYLEQAGANVEFLNLTAMGVPGNGHLSFLEMNNLQVASIALEWFEKVEVTR